MRFKRCFEATGQPAALLAYVADFRNLTDWEPSVTAVEQVSGSHFAVGAQYHVVMRFLGQSLSMDYRLSEFEPGRFALLEGYSDGAQATDRITVSAKGDRVEVCYAVELQLTSGKARLLAPLIYPAFGLSVSRAARSLARALDRCAG